MDWLEQRETESRGGVARLAARLRLVAPLRAPVFTPPVLGLVVLVLTIVPAYLLSRPDAARTAREVASLARADAAAEAATEPFDPVEIEAHIRKVAIRHRISPLLVAAIVEAESEFNPRAVSRKGARGLMQLMPLTASSLSVEDSFDPYKNIEGGVRHLRRLMNRFRGNLPLVLAAYNAGEQAVVVYRGVPPYRETRRYVARILRRIGHRDTRPVATRAAVRAPAPRAVTVATPAGLGEPAREALARQAAVERAAAERAAMERASMEEASMETSRSPVAPPADDSQGTAERAPTPTLRTDRAGRQGP